MSTEASLVPGLLEVAVDPEGQATSVNVQYEVHVRGGGYEGPIGTGKAAVSGEAVLVAARALAAAARAELERIVGLEEEEQILDDKEL